MKLNCWEAKQCGRHQGGDKVEELGVCPASVEKRLDGVNGGTNGGRACWAIPLTLCENRVQDMFTEKFSSCINCNFYALVREEEGQDFALSSEIMEKVNLLFTSFRQQ